MNLLAHALLSGSEPGLLLGNLLADFVKGENRRLLPPAVQAGMIQHQKIDAFTDSHPLVRNSRARIAAPYRRYSGILVDVFYDHFLVQHWQDFGEGSVDDFARDIYALATRHAADLPDEARAIIAAMSQRNILLACRQVEGVEKVLERIALRLARRSGRAIEMAGGVAFLRDAYGDFAADFRAFFPELQEHVRQL
jgi:acyl carrier protein phosphodiesterase